MAKTKYKIKIDKEKCIGCGSCVAVCPANFKLEGAKAIVKKSESDLECNQEAANTCPVSAITVKKG